METNFENTQTLFSPTQMVSVTIEDLSTETQILESLGKEKVGLYLTPMALGFSIDHRCEYYMDHSTLIKTTPLEMLSLKISINTMTLAILNSIGITSLQWRQNHGSNFFFAGLYETSNCGSKFPAC